MGKKPTFIPDLVDVTIDGCAYALIRLPRERIVKILRRAEELEKSGEAERFRQREEAGAVLRAELVDEDDGDDVDALSDLAAAAVQYLGRRKSRR